MLAGRRELGIVPGTERIAGLLALMGDPHRSYPAVHVAGTNGKTSAVRLTAAILAAHGLLTGSFTTPPLDRPEEQFARNGEEMDDLGAALADLMPFLDLHERGSSARLTEFELTTALAFSWLAATSADAVVIEAGMGGRDDATNVLDAAVSVITGVAMDHAEYLGGSLAEIAATKAAIVTAGSTLVTGPLSDAAATAIEGRVAAVGADWRRFGEDFRIDGLTRAVGGWVVDIDGVHEHYGEVFLPLQGRHQTRNLAVAVAAAEAFFARALDPEAVRAGAASVVLPGRLEAVSGTPLVVLDVAHNPDGIAAVAAALPEAFPPTEWTVIFGARGGRDPAAMLEPLAGAVTGLVAVAAQDPAAVPASEIADAARRALGAEVAVGEAQSVAAAILHALATAGTSGVLVTGSHRVVAEARRVLRG